MDSPCTPLNAATTMERLEVALARLLRAETQLAVVQDECTRHLLMLEQQQDRLVQEHQQAQRAHEQMLHVLHEQLLIVKQLQQHYLARLPQ